MFMAKQTALGSLAYPPEWKRKDCSGIESSKGRRFATSANSGKSVFLSAMMTMSRIGFDYGYESYDEHGKPEQQLDAPADAFGAVVRIAGLAVRDGLARPFLLTGNTGATHGVHTDVLRLCSAFIPNADEITTCRREKNAELSDSCRTAIQAGMRQIPSVSDGNGARKRTAR